MQFDKCVHARTAPARGFELCSPVIRAVSVREACTLESRTEMLTLYEFDWMGVSKLPMAHHLDGSNARCSFGLSRLPGLPYPP